MRNIHVIKVNILEKQQLLLIGRYLATALENRKNKCHDCKRREILLFSSKVFNAKSLMTFHILKLFKSLLAIPNWILIIKCLS